MGHNQYTVPVPAEDRFWSKVYLPPCVDDCWLWTGYRKASQGYGFFYVSMSEPIVTAHRFSYRLNVGPIPAGLQIDHLCRNKGCVNPSHLEAVTSRENTLRGIGISALNALKTHCPQGHPYSFENTLVDAKRKRYCRTCHRERDHSRTALAALQRCLGTLP